MKKLLCFLLIALSVLVFGGCRTAPPENFMNSGAFSQNEEKKAEKEKEERNITAKIQENNGKDAKEPSEDEKPSENPLPITEEAAEEVPQEDFVTITISCKKAVLNYDKLSEEAKNSLVVPESGIILPETRVLIKGGETVFDVLKKVCMENKIHLESSYTPVFESAYIEGINNLYEFQCGPLSGWMYSVGGDFVGHGSSSHVLKAGDKIVFEYTCDLGRDLKAGM